MVQVDMKKVVSLLELDYFIKFFYIILIQVEEPEPTKEIKKEVEEEEEESKKDVEEVSDTKTGETTENPPVETVETIKKEKVNILFATHLIPLQIEFNIYKIT